MVDPKSLRVPERFLKNTISPACGGDEAIVEAFRRVPREFFIDEAMKVQAYSDNALPIGYGQTISQPSLVASMIYHLDVKPHHKCMEIGSGSGFVSALLGILSDEVYAIEIIPQLHNSARDRVRRLFINNVRFFLSDGSIGYKSGATYDRVIASAGANSIPQSLIDQLSDNEGVMIIPLNGELLKIVKSGGEIAQEVIAKVAFVNFINT